MLLFVCSIYRSDLRARVISLSSVSCSTICLNALYAKSAWSSFGATKKTFAPYSPSRYTQYAVIAATRSVFPFLRAITMKISRNILTSFSSTIPNITDIIAFSHSSNFKRSFLPSLWWQKDSIKRTALFAFFGLKAKSPRPIPHTMYSYSSLIHFPALIVPLCISL